MLNDEFSSGLATFGMLYPFATRLLISIIFTLFDYANDGRLQVRTKEMVTRRKFLRRGALGAYFLASTNVLASCLEGRPDGGKANKPIVISTWDFGVAANAAAWELLSAGGSALDAVEAGVRIAEA